MYYTFIIQILSAIKMSKVQNPEKSSQKILVKEQVSQLSSECQKLNHLFDHNTSDYETNEFLVEDFVDRKYGGGERNVQKIKFLRQDVSQFYQNTQPILHNRAIKTEQSQVKPIKTYEKNVNFIKKQTNYLTFGPQDFPTNSKSNNNNELQKISQKQENNSSEYQNMSKKLKNPQVQVKSTTDIKIIEQKKKRPKLYEIMCKQVGMSQEKVCKLKSDCLNYQLDKFVKKKGLQYLQQNREKTKRLYTQLKDNTIENNNLIITKNITIRPAQNQKKTKQGKNKSESKLVKNFNYMPEVFPQINKRNSSKKTIFSQGATKTKLVEEKSKNKQRGNFNRSQTKKQIKCSILNDQQEMLGKIVYDKVQNHFNLDKKKADYFTRVKSQEQIDEAWIQYLRTKVDRAHLMLK